MFNFIWMACLYESLIVLSSKEKLRTKTLDILQLLLSWVFSSVASTLVISHSGNLPSCALISRTDFLLELWILFFSCLLTCVICRHFLSDLIFVISVINGKGVKQKVKNFSSVMLDVCCFVKKYFLEVSNSGFLQVTWFSKRLTIMANYHQNRKPSFHGMCCSYCFFLQLGHVSVFAVWLHFLYKEKSRSRQNKSRKSIISSNPCAWKRHSKARAFACAHFK